MGQYIYLFIGESGSGKTTLCNQLAERGYKQLWSYTTRKPRCPNESGHVFVDEFPQNTRCVAYTKFDGNEYWATVEQVDESDTYVVDPDGLHWFMTHYRGEKRPVIFYISTSRWTRRRRMKDRGDASSDIRRRLKHDREEFRQFRKDAYGCSKDLPVTIIVDNNSDDNGGLQTVLNYIGFFEDGDIDTDPV